MKTIRLIHNLPRTGGTIVSKSIGAQKNIILLSEIHPEGVTMRSKMKVNSDLGDPVYQSFKYYNLFTVEEYEKIKNSNIGFEDKIEIILKKTLLLGKNLIIRDWAFVDFFGIPFSKPTYKNMLFETLKSKYKILNIYLLRNPLETLISCYNSLPFFKDNYKFETFIKSYESFLLDTTDDRNFKFEDFCIYPEENLKRICKKLKIDFDENYLNKLGNIKVIGDPTGIESKKINKEKGNYSKNLLTKEQKDKIDNNNDYKNLMLKLKNYY